VYCDVKTFKVPKRQGYKYYVIFVDEFSDWIAIYPIKTKGEAASALRRFRSELFTHSCFAPASSHSGDTLVTNSGDNPVTDFEQQQMGANNRRPMTLRSDGDPSCVDNRFFKSTAEELGILLDFTSTYTPQHNRAERAIEAIDYKARVALIDAPHPDFNSHYYDASASAVYLHNRLVGSRGKTPYEHVKHQR
jgi:hypothetical protein